jgi:hypothetical protein
VPSTALDGGRGARAERLDELVAAHRPSHENDAPRVTGWYMSRQALGNALAGVLFLVVAIVDFTRDSSGIGVVFVVFAAVFLGLAFSGKNRH